MTLVKYPAKPAKVGSPTGWDLRMPPQFYVWVEALIDGLRRTDWALNSTCRQALVALGQLALRSVQRAACDEGLSGPHASRLAEVVAAIERGPCDLRQAVPLMLSALWQAVRFPDDQLTLKAGEAIGLCAPGVVDRLIVEAVCCQPKPAECIRLLRAARYTRQTPTPEVLQTLSVLTTAKHPRIREQATRLSMHYRDMRVVSNERQKGVAPERA